jgi:methionyl-tRNA formyltransferase
MKIFLCGQKAFGAAVLNALIGAGHEITGVAPAPQGKRYDELKIAATRAGVPIRSNAGAVTHIDIPDGTELVISAHSHWYIPDRVVQKCKYGGIGFHPSLLPRHRGRDAVRWAVAMGDAITGASIYWLSDVVDGGDILIQKPIFIDKAWDYHDLWRRIFPVGVDLMLEAVRLIGEGKAPHNQQDERFKTWEPPFDPDKRLQRNDPFMLGGGNV